MLASHARFKRVFAVTVRDDTRRLAHLTVLTDSVNATRRTAVKERLPRFVPWQIPGELASQAQETMLQQLLSTQQK